MYLPNENIVKKERCVKFIRNEQDDDRQSAEYEENLLESPKPEEEDQSDIREINEEPAKAEENKTDMGSTSTNQETAKKYPKRARKPPSYLDDYVNDDHDIDFVDTAS